MCTTFFNILLTINSKISKLYIQERELNPDAFFYNSEIKGRQEQLNMEKEEGGRLLPTELKEFHSIDDDIFMQTLYSGFTQNALVYQYYTL